RAILRGALRHGQRIHHVEDALHPAVETPAALAFLQVPFSGEAIAFLAVIMQDQLLFTQVIHFAVLTKGSSALLSFCTARNTLCLAAPGWQPRTWLTSSMHMPSKCRSTKAVRSEALNSFMASA